MSLRNFAPVFLVPNVETLGFSQLSLPEQRSRPHSDKPMAKDIKKHDQPGQEDARRKRSDRSASNFSGYEEYRNNPENRNESGGNILLCANQSVKPNPRTDRHHRYRCQDINYELKSRQRSKRPLSLRSASSFGSVGR